MKLPHMKRNISKRQRQIIAFGGLRFDEGGSDGELSGSLNLSARKYPCLTQREGRVQHQTGENITALYASDGLYWVDGEKLYQDGGEAGTVTAGEKMFASIHGDVLVFPDKKLYDASDKTLLPLQTEHVSLAGMVSFSGSTMSVSASGTTTYYADETVTTETWKGCDSDYVDSYEQNALKTAYVQTYQSIKLDLATGIRETGEAKTRSCDDVPIGSYITKMDSLSGTHTLPETEYGVVISRGERTKGKALMTGTYYDYYETVYFREYTVQIHRAVERQITSLPEEFRVGDAVEISGCTTHPENNKTAVIKEITDAALVFDATFTAGEEAGQVKITRKIPQFDCLCERDNRIYGAEGNTIYVSALGDPYNFFLYEGIDTDSFSIAVASEGRFTACAPYDNGVVFFKEDMVYKLLGDYPSEYTLYAYHMPGVQAGSAGSVVNINEVLYYKGKDGVYSYTGGAPRSISENFGLRRYKNAVGGGDGTLYYIAMDDEAGARHVFTYDTEKGLWLEEDDLAVVGFAHTGGSLYAATAGEILLTSGGDIEDMPWQADFVPITEDWYGKKSYSTLYLRLDITPGAWVQVWLSRDGGPFVRKWASHDASAPTMTAYIRPDRCDRFRIRLVGKGKVVLRALTREMELGSEV